MHSDWMNCKTIAVMGGTFDPVHTGHLMTAEAARTLFDIDKVIFIPTGTPPHKEPSHLSDSHHRYLMAELAVASNPAFEVSCIEISRKGQTYTIDTLTELRNKTSPNTEIFFITGADTVQQITTWKDYAHVLKLCRFIAVSRHGCDDVGLFATIDELKRKHDACIHYAPMPVVEISSSDIRRRVSSGESIRYLVPEPVEAYIYKNKLYSKKAE